jgi:hypothetical protein
MSGKPLPNYRKTQCCATCKWNNWEPDFPVCEKYNFIINPVYVCDGFEPEKKIEE